MSSSTISNASLSFKTILLVSELPSICIKYACLPSPTLKSISISISISLSLSNSNT